MDVFGTAKNAYDLGKSIYDSVRDAKVQQALAELLAKLNEVLLQLGEIAASSLKLERENQQLRQENDQMKQWDQEKEQHVLKCLGPGSVVYVPKDAEHKPGGAEQQGYYLCPNCYERRQKSYLQFVKIGFDGTHLVCPSCKADVIDRENRAKAEIWTGSPRTKWDGFI